MTLRALPDPPPDPLVGKTVVLPSGEHGRVLSIEHEYDDGTTLEYVTGDYAGAQTMRDTFLIRRYPVIEPCHNCRRYGPPHDDTPCGACGAVAGAIERTDRG